MSRIPFFFVEKFNNCTKKYELQHPMRWNWNHTQQIVADLFPYSDCHDLFSIVENNTNCFFPLMNGIHQGLPEDVSTEIQKAFDNCCYKIDCDNKEQSYRPSVHWFTYADMYIYYLKYPKISSYGIIDEPIKPTPLKTLIDRVDSFLNVMNDSHWEDDYSQIRIVYWIE